MTICDFCSKELFSDEDWGYGDITKIHHVDSSAWETSVAHPCTICIRLADVLKSAANEAIQANSAFWKLREQKGWNLGLDLIKDVSILNLIGHALPLYTVECMTSSRNKWTLLFKLVSENVRKIKFQTELGTVDEIAMKQMNFVVSEIDPDEDSFPSDLPGCTKSETGGVQFQQVQEWLKACSDHPHCQGLLDPLSDASIKPPTRLLDLGDPQSNQYDPSCIQLIETHQSSTYRKYATLSHCWGRRIPVQTWPHNFAEFLKPNGIRMDAAFPPNFKDAVEVARSLGLRYLWIDSLCIIQDDPHKPSDFDKEKIKMHSVYGNSFLNIAAAGSRSSAGGLFRQRNKDILEPSTVTVRWQQNELECYVIRDPFWSGELLSDEPLYNRGWVVQERMLSPRTVHFATRQIFWQCLEKTACEMMPETMPDAIQDTGREETQWRRSLRRNRGSSALEFRDRIDLQEVWRDLVEKYTSCIMTNTLDKLPGIAGLAEAMNDACGEDWVAGLWGNGWTLVEQLSWQVERCRNANGQPSKRQGQELKSYRAPSWSWVSVDGVIRLSERANRGTKYQLEIKDKYLETEAGQGPDTPANYQFGNLKSGHLTVSGLLHKANFTRSSTMLPYWQWDIDIPETERPRCFLRPDEPLTEDHGVRREDKPKLDVHVLHLFYGISKTSKVQDGDGAYTGKALAIKETKDGAFTRLGLIEFDDISQQLWPRFTDKREEADGRCYKLI